MIPYKQWIFHKNAAGSLRYWQNEANHPSPKRNPCEPASEFELNRCRLRHLCSNPQRLYIQLHGKPRTQWHPRLPKQCLFSPSDCPWQGISPSLQRCLCVYQSQWRLRCIMRHLHFWSATIAGCFHHWRSNQAPGQESRQRPISGRCNSWTPSGSGLSPPQGISEGLSPSQHRRACLCPRSG